MIIKAIQVLWLQLRLETLSYQRQVKMKVKLIFMMKKWMNRRVRKIKNRLKINIIMGINIKNNIWKIFIMLDQILFIIQREIYLNNNLVIVTIVLDLVEILIVVSCQWALIVELKRKINTISYATVKQWIEWMI